MDDKNFYASFGFLFNESVILNETEELEKISIPTAAFKKDTNMFCSEFIEGFDLWSFDYGKTITLLSTGKIFGLQF